MSLDLSRFHATFFAESLEGLNQVEESLLGIEQRGHDKDALDAIFRAIHSLKGSAGSLGFGYGAMSHWFSEVYVKFKRDSAETMHYDALEWENKFQLTETEIGRAHV